MNTAAANPRATLLLYDCRHVCREPERLPLWAALERFLRTAGMLTAAATPA